MTQIPSNTLAPFYLLCDCNNFFASCERVFRPDLDKKPVVVLSNNDGCVIARSNEAKAIGILMGQPLYQLKDLIRIHQVSVFSANFELYGDLSTRVMNILKSWIPNIEVYSIDEAFLLIDGISPNELIDLARKIRQQILQWTGIPVSIGISTSKTLAKVAAKLSKKYPKLNGVCLMYKPEDIKKVLSTFPIEDVWGIGRRYTKFLKKWGIVYAEQFRQSPPQWIQSQMSIVGLNTWKELHGEACIGIDDRRTNKQSICVSRSFAKELSSPIALYEALAGFLISACEKLRKQKSLAAQIQVFVHTNRHREELTQHQEARLIQLSTHSDSTLEMLHYLKNLIPDIYKQGCAYKKAGIILNDIQSNAQIQSDLFDLTDRPKHQALMKTLDTLNAKHGKRVVNIAAQGEGYKANQNFISHRFTTRLEDILTVKI